MGSTAQSAALPNAINNAVLIAVVFSLTCLAWIFFRANSTADAFYIIQRILSFEDFHLASIRNKILVAKVAVLIFILLLIEAADRRFDMEALLLKSPCVPRGGLCHAPVVDRVVRDVRIDHVHLLPVLRGER